MTNQLLPYIDETSGLRRTTVRHPDGNPPPADGCRWCGRLHELYELWVAGRGFHRWTAPTDAQRTARAAASREAAPARPARCEHMNHDGRGRETFCEIQDPDHDEDHDDGHGTTWPREDD